MKPFRMYRIVCTITNRALINGSDCPHGFDASPNWYDRGFWSPSSGTFWKTEDTVKKHLRNLCHDWERGFREIHSRHGFSHYDTTRYLLSKAPDWSRLKHLEVEEFFVTKYTTIKLPASDFMGINASVAA